MSDGTPGAAGDPVSIVLMYRVRHRYGRVETVRRAHDVEVRDLGPATTPILRSRATGAITRYRDWVSSAGLIWRPSSTPEPLEYMLFDEDDPDGVFSRHEDVPVDERIGEVGRSLARMSGSVMVSETDAIPGWTIYVPSSMGVMLPDIAFESSLDSSSAVFIPASFGFAAAARAARDRGVVPGESEDVFIPEAISALDGQPDPRAAELLAERAMGSADSDFAAAAASFRVALDRPSAQELRRAIDALLEARSALDVARSGAESVPDARILKRVSAL